MTFWESVGLGAYVTLAVLSAWGMIAPILGRAGLISIPFFFWSLLIIGLPVFVITTVRAYKG